MPKDIKDLLARGSFLGLIGPAGVGKDTTAERIEYAPVKFARPLYEMAERISDTCLPVDHIIFEKSMPGGRQFLQQLGAWGRGEVSEQHPWSIQRAFLVDWIRHTFDLAFGGGPEYWVDQFKASVKLRLMAQEKLACTDMRYTNEVDTLVEMGGIPCVIACRPESLRNRREFLGYTEASLTDSSEQLARILYGQVLQGFQPEGYEVIWADTEDSCPEFAYAVL